MGVRELSSVSLISKVLAPLFPGPISGPRLPHKVISFDKVIPVGYGRNVLAVLGNAIIGIQYGVLGWERQEV